MGNGKIQNIGVREGTLKIARDEIHYNCQPHEWQMFEILVSFCKDCPDIFNKWKQDKLGKLKEKWQTEKITRKKSKR